jgi:hypothetical protein
VILGQFVVGQPALLQARTLAANPAAPESSESDD